VNCLSVQAVGCALYVLGFGESMAELVGLNSPWAERGFASAAVLLLGMINVAGVKWVIKLQFVLLLILLLAGVDFAVGSFIHTDVGKTHNLNLLNFNLYVYFTLLPVCLQQ
jgi:potassium/chloride transporter 8